jgi:hypothetical protein
MTATRPFIGSILLTVALSSCGSTHDGMPSPPSDLKVEPLTGGAHLTWKDNSDNEAEFMIERKVGAGAFQTLTSVPFDTVQHHDAMVAKGMTYVYRVMAMPKSGGHGTDTKFSNEASFTAP